MANVQIYQLDNAGSDLDNSALLAMDIPNPDTSAASEVPYVTRKESIASLETQMLQTDEYTTELDTTRKTITGAINEQQSVIGYSYDEYDATTAYATGDLCIYNNVLYKAKQATTGNLPTNTTYWEETSIADEISELKSKNTIEDIAFTVASASITDVNIKAVRYGNNVMLTGYFRTTASIPDGTTILSGLANPYTPSGDNNLYFNLLNETDGTLQRFRINSPYSDFKNQGALASGKTFVGTLTYICQ